MKKFTEILTEADEIGQELDKPVDPQAELRSTFTRFRTNMIKFMRVLKGTALPNIDNQSDFKSIFDDYKKLKNFGPARTWWIKLSEELGVDQKFWRIFDQSENGLMDYRLMEYINALIAKVQDPILKPAGKREVVAAINHLTQSIRPSFRTEIFKKLSEIEGQDNALAGIQNVKSVGGLANVDKRILPRI